MSFLRRAVERRSYLPVVTGGSNPYVLPTNQSLAPLTSAGVQVDDHNALAVPAAYACVRLVAGTVSTLPLHAYVENNGIVERVKPTPQVIAEPFFGVPREEGITQLMVSLLLRGNAYMFVTERDNMARPTQFQILHPDMVKVGYQQGTALKAYEVNRQPVAREDMVHIVTMVWPGSPLGISPVQMCRGGFGLALATEEFGARLFGQGATPRLAIKSPEKWTTETAQARKDELEYVASGLSNAHRPLILTGGMDVMPLTMAPEEAQFLQTRAFQNGQIAMIFGVPPHLIGDVDKSTSWGKGLEEQGRAFVSFGLRFYLARLESALNRQLPDGMSVRFDTDELDRAEMAVRYAANASAISMGWKSRDEVRYEEGLPPIPDGQGAVFLHPLNLGGADPTTQSAVKPAPPVGEK